MSLYKYISALQKTFIMTNSRTVTEDTETAIYHSGKKELQSRSYNIQTTWSKQR